MNKKELNEKIYNKFSDTLSKEMNDTVFNLVFDGIEELLINDFEIIVKNYGKLAIKDNKERISTNPATGEIIKSPASRSVKFKMTNLSKQELNS